MDKHLDRKEEYEKIYLKYLDSLYHVALRLTKNPVEAENLVADTFRRAFRFFSKFRKGTNIKAWLFKIMYNVFYNKQRKKKRESEMLELKEEILIQGDVKEDFFSKFMDTEIEEALNSLPLEFRKIVILSDLEGFSAPPSFIPALGLRFSLNAHNLRGDYTLSAGDKNAPFS